MTQKRINQAAKGHGRACLGTTIVESYSDLIKSDIADYKNTGGRAAGTITAAAFLSKFVGDFPWVHLDIAGPSWSAKGRTYIPKGHQASRYVCLWNFCVVEFINHGYNNKKQALVYYTLRFAGLFNLPIPLRFAFGIGVSQ